MRGSDSLARGRCAVPSASSFRVTYVRWNILLSQDWEENQCHFGYVAQKIIQRKGFRFTRPLSLSQRGDQSALARNAERSFSTESTTSTPTTRAGNSTVLPSHGQF